MRPDLLVLISILSLASIVILYILYTYDDGIRVVYDTAANLRLRLNKKLNEKLPECCHGLTKECLSCATGVLISDFCSRHIGEYGCNEIDTKSI